MQKARKSKTTAIRTSNQHARLNRKFEMSQKSFKKTGIRVSSIEAKKQNEAIKTEMLVSFLEEN